MTARRLLLASLLVFAAPPAFAQSCDDIARRLDTRVAQLPVVASQESALRAIGAQALAAMPACAANGRLWYLAARAAEVLDPRAGQDPLGTGADAPAIARQAFAAQPRAAPVATIVARLSDDVGIARQAHAAAPGYAPARRVLAVALARRDRSSEALSLLGTGKSTSDRVARARVFLALSRPADAVRESKAALAGPLADPDEPATDAGLRQELDETLGLALLALGKRGEAKAPLRRAADGGSQAALQALSRLH
jgi:hypothetical protein